MAFVDRLTPVLLRGDADAARELLDGLSGTELQEARRWFAGSRRWARELHDLPYEGATSDERHAAFDEAQWIVGMCAVALSGPVTAARRVPWTWLWDHQQSAGEAAFVHLLWDSDREWVAPFVEAAAAVALGANARNVNRNLSRVLRAAVVFHGLPCPRGRTFLARWLAGAGTGAPVEVLARDPLMPDLLFHYLASGHCGQDAWLPAATAELVRRGVVHRGSLLEHVLSLLTAPQRPASQRVLAEIAAALGLQADEIAGGLPYVLGVLATSSGAVGKRLLPSAIELVREPRDLLELTAVIAGRPERKQKEVLLAGLRAPSVAAAVGPEAVLEALRLLGDDPDSAFADRVARVARALRRDDSPAPAGAVPVEEEAATALWELLPAPSGEDHTPPWWRNGEPSWFGFLSAGPGREPPASDGVWLVDLALEAMRTGSFADGAAVREATTRLLRGNALSVSRLTTALSDLFLGGGLRQGWPVALSIAEDACGAPRPPAGLAELLRMLASYAPAVPAQDLPAGIAALAAGEGRAKSRVEARRLGAALARTEPDVLVRRLRARALPATERPAPRGLWAVGPAPEVLPSQVRLDELPHDLESLRSLVGADFNHYAQSHGDVSFWPPGYSSLSSATDLTHPDRVLAAAVRAISVFGSDAVRSALTGIERRYEPLDVVAALDLWIAGRLDVPTFWRVVGASVTHREVVQRWAADPDVTQTEAWHRATALPGLAEAVAALSPEPLVLPRALDSPAARLAFLRAAEALLRAEQAPVLLSTPTWADGTLDLDDLVERLRATDGAPVGPLDLVQALHRLRPADPSRLVEVELPLLRTAAAVTSPQGDDTWDARHLVRTWVGSGGLPPLRPFVSGSRWATSARAPVPWSSCAALPSELRSDPWCPGSMVETVRLLPTWGDRTIVDAYSAWSYYDPRFFPGRIAGPFGLPLHDRLLALITSGGKGHQTKALATVLDVARHDRLDPEQAAAAALGRHRAGTLALGRLAQSLAACFEAGGLRGLWSSAVAIADALCAASPKPSGLPDLLRLLASYAHEVPERAVPEALRGFAAERGTSRSHVEARLLVSALEAA